MEVLALKGQLVSILLTHLHYFDISKPLSHKYFLVMSSETMITHHSASANTFELVGISAVVDVCDYVHMLYTIKVLEE